MLALLKSKTVLAGILLAVGELVSYFAPELGIGALMVAGGYALLGIGVKHAIEKNTEDTRDAKHAAQVAAENAAHAENAANAAVTDVQTVNRGIKGAIADTIREVVPDVLSRIITGKK